jgi:DNA-binding NtrC family response regulator
MKKKLFVLMIEDRVEDSEITARYLRKAGYEIIYQRVDTAAAMKSALQDKKWDVILSDYSMPEFDVPTALEIYREFGIDIPFIIISGAIGEEKAVELIKAGVHDYLLKDNMIRFVSVVERELREAKIRRDLVKANEQLDLLNQHQVNAREEERALISMEIHDELGQALTALKLDLNWVRRNMPSGTHSDERLGKMIEVTNEII